MPTWKISPLRKQNTHHQDLYDPTTWCPVGKSEQAIKISSPPGGLLEAFRCRWEPLGAVDRLDQH